MNATLDPTNVSAPTGGTASEKIRRRLVQAERRFHANDNIHDFLKAGELGEIQAEVAVHLRAVLKALVIDVDNDHNTQETAERVAKMFVREVFQGRYEAPPAVTEFPNISKLNELMIVGPVTVRSACSHHLCPIMGKVWIGVLPNEETALICLSKYARLVRWVMNRPQIQEEAISQVADLLENKMRPNGLAIVMEADHFCMQWRGVQDMEPKMINSIMRGEFLDNASLRREFLSLCTQSQR